MSRAWDGPVLIVGARSDIGLAVAHAYAAEGLDLILAARQVSLLDPVSRDLALRHCVHVDLVECDLLAPEPERLATSLPELPGTIVMVAGLLGDQSKSAAEPPVAEVVMRTNFVSPARVLLAFAGRFQLIGSGTMIGISSVAGDRGRGSNYVYGASKAGLTAFLSGLRNGLSGSGVHVITVKPGFVQTKMTEHMRLPALLTASPEEVAQAILRAHRGGKDVIYVRPIWRAIMAVIRLLPESLFKRIRL